MNGPVLPVLRTIFDLEGPIAAALVDPRIGICLADTHASASHLVDMDVAAMGISEMFNAQHSNLTEAELEHEMEDLIINTVTQAHLIRVAPGPLLLYVVMERGATSMSLVQHKMKEMERLLFQK
ncbi:MAG: hypothetical protein OHK0029_37990 [Armatimonadaceae bacterium]